MHESPFGGVKIRLSKLAKCMIPAVHETGSSSPLGQSRSTIRTMVMMVVVVVVAFSSLATILGESSTIYNENNEILI